VRRVVYGAPDLRLGALGSFIDLRDFKHPFHEIDALGGVFAEESASLLKQFFRRRRMESKQREELAKVIERIESFYS